MGESNNIQGKFINISFSNYYMLQFFYYKTIISYETNVMISLCVVVFKFIYFIFEIIKVIFFLKKIDV